MHCCYSTVVNSAWCQLDSCKLFQLASCKLLPATCPLYGVPCQIICDYIKWTILNANIICKLFGGFPDRQGAVTLLNLSPPCFPRSLVQTANCQFDFIISQNNFLRRKSIPHPHHHPFPLKVHKNENLFGFDFEICTFS